MVTGHGAQVGEGAAQIAQCPALGPVAPEEASQERPSVGPAGDDQVAEQGLLFAGVEAGHGPAGAADRQAA